MTQCEHTVICRHKPDAIRFALLAQRVTREMTTFLYWIGVAHPELVKDPSGDFSKKISECREMWREPYSKETLNGIHDALKLHRG